MVYNFFKRLIDFIGSSIALIIISPVLVIFVFLVKFSSPGPIFYTPERVGKDGKIFKMFKFRSMRMYNIKGNWVHAQKYLEINPSLKRKYQKSSFKLKDDPRVTPIGKILRRLSIDEMPQLVNVLKGNMSLVGPRAYQHDELVHQQKVYPKTRKFVKIILEARPGASGPWQVSGRSFINFDRRVQMDATYVKKKSILYDIWIIIKTPVAMLIGKGAI
ncbi:MAG: Exopolysaccharide biosynthesis polyprenyl glycosylphosphotransferase [Candidatus Curtissbacteria bacterium GW2011_GWA1_41_11]|uniref:Exopolysaccharide biosynthesis polyprenyl glycosylphosphotransferase n=1 Tax=Candidatus Curtissbacteria bacterium GW2011_GWA1_41_11 TaxID=1618409 RepID=A0A0G0WUL4_9BACT|nr:MAG: Exopolysaccharide biosynthesis polyprenyl glycosylphosphotransferase [Candidatus Curtissbacteria bacterium GW2011_GWA1_41_11]